MAPTTANAPTATVTKRGRKAKADAGLNVCLDYLKGKCTREQCRFVHPDLTVYQQLSEAVEAQAGREICEVWALTGQCKFGAKCNKLHPIVVSRPDGPVITIPDTGATPAEGAEESTMVLPMPVAPQHVMPAASPDLTAEFEKFAESMRKTLAEEEEEECWQPSSKEVTGKDVEEFVPQYSTARRLLQSVLGLDSVLIDIFRDLNLVSC